MSLYIIMYIFSIFASIFMWGLIYKIYRNYFWLFFLFFTIFSSIWVFSYFLFFCWIEKSAYLLFFSKLCYLTSIYLSYCLLFSIYLFNKPRKFFEKEFLIKIWLFFLSLAILYLWTDYIISWLYFSKKDLVYREEVWNLFFIHIILNFIFIISFIYYSKVRIKEQVFINKVRLSYILLSSFLMLCFYIIFQLVLPIFWIRLFEKQSIFVFFIFILIVFLIAKKYYFARLWTWIGKILIIINSILLSVFTTNTLTIAYLKINNWYWWIQDLNWISNNIISIIFFMVYYKIFSKIFLWYTQKNELKLAIWELEQRISHVDNINHLNVFLKKEAKKIFKTDNCEIKLYSKIWEKFELKKYFENKLNEKIFINDSVFLEEKKNKFDKYKIKKELNKNDFLIFPIYNKNNNIWYFSLWTKAFWDFYNIDEINALKNLLFFIEYHLWYIKNYEKIQDLNLNLDKKVDEKTIEFNNLINKQKEFISMISHEIRSPIWSAIFQADSIIDDLNWDNTNNEKLKKEMNVLNSLLIRTWELTTKLFSVQYYDTHSISLYKEKIQISLLLKNQLEIFSHINENIKFIDRINPKMWFIEIDKIQFQQVIENLLTNAVKFINKEKWIIAIEAYIENNYLIIKIKDNWKWFNWINIWDLFDKYAKWSWNSTWLWMWLYLCKKIIDMHNWEISAWLSKELWWAKFKIKIPLN